MIRLSFLSLLFIKAGMLFFGCSNEPGPPEIVLKYEENLTLEYEEVIDAYRALADHYPGAALFEMGQTDVGRPLHLFMISGDGDFEPASLKRKGRAIILINNGIHAGEPAGIDASIEFAAGLLSGKNTMDRILDNTVIAIVPVYNIGGALNMSRYHRMNQNGPVYKGSRRNARNLDLNRDFIKMDSENARSFAAIFHHLDPDVFVDTHSTNGSDHQFVMTLIPTMHQKLPGEMGSFFKNEMVPWLYQRMNDDTPYGMVPYVQMAERGNIRGGITGFNDHPYYSTGFASLFNCFAFMTETLVYKPFPERVKATYEFIRLISEYTSDNNAMIRSLREEAFRLTTGMDEFIVDWVTDRGRFDMILFRGYEAEPVVTPLTGRETTLYDHARKWEDSIRFYDYFRPAAAIKAPVAYVIPQAWREVIELMKLNGVEISRLENDTVMLVESIYFDDYNFSASPSQGRHQVRDFVKRREAGRRQFYRGDAIIYINQRANRYIVNVLEPVAPASFFRWGFFNPVLEDGESFWIYAFEDYACQALETDPELRELFDMKMKEETGFSNDPVAMLRFVFDRVATPEVERGYNLYPVARIN